MTTQGEFLCRLLAHQILVGVRTKPPKCRWKLGAVGFICANQLLSSSQICPPTNLLLLKLVFNPLVTGTCSLKVALVGAHKSSNPCSWPPHPRRPPECGWLTACAYLHANTSNPLLSRIQWAGNLHRNSPLTSTKIFTLIRHSNEL